jgi:predicted membrane protein DUF2178
MSFREKSAWASLLSTLAVWGYYFLQLGQEIAAGQVRTGDFIGLFVGCTITLVVVQVAIAILLAVHAGREADAPADERERAIELKASHAAYQLLVVLVVAAALAGPVVGIFSRGLFAADAAAGTALVMASLAILAVVLAELVRSSAQIFHYRRVG